MRKVLIIYLLISFFVSPLINYLGHVCHADNNTQLCQMHEDVQEYEHGSNHCQGCNLNIYFPKIFSLASFDEAVKDNVFSLDVLLLTLDIHNNLYRPPVA